VVPRDTGAARLKQRERLVVALLYRAPQAERPLCVKSCQALLVSPLGPAASMECLGDIEHPSQNVRIANRTLSRSHLTGDPAEKHEAADFCAELR